MPHYRGLSWPALSFLFLASFGSTACSDNGTPTEEPEPEPTTLTKLSGDNQSAAVSTQVADPLVVQVKDQSGNGMSGVVVAWEVIAGDGEVSDVSTTTGSNGSSSVGFTVGTLAGEHTVRATVNGIASAATFSVTGLPGSTSVLEISRDSLGFSAVGDTAHIEGSASDQYGNQVAIAWSTDAADVATVDEQGIVTSQGNGAASILATAGDTSRTVIAIVSQIPTAARIAGGDGQTGPAGETLLEDLAVSVLDANEVGVPGVPVLWVTGATSGTVTADSTETSSDGTARVSWTLGLHSGTDTVVASAAGLESQPFTFTATATPNGVISGSINFTNVLQSVSTASIMSVEAGASGGSNAFTDRGARDEELAVAYSGSRSTPRNTDSEPQYVPGSLIVTYRPDAVSSSTVGTGRSQGTDTYRGIADELRASLEANAKGQGFLVRGVSPAILAARLKTDPGRTEAIRRALLRNPKVAAVEREKIVYGYGRLAKSAAATGVTPTDPLYRWQMWHYNSIDLPAAWARTTGNSSVVVAVVDDGTRFDHPAISANLTSDGYDFVSSMEVDVCGVTFDNAGDGDGYDSDPTTPFKLNESTCDYGSAHGLHVAGTIGATGNDGVGVTGVNWSVAVRPVRAIGVAGIGTHYDIAQAILYAAGLPADDGAGGTVQAASSADIINLSLGFSGTSTNLENAVSLATEAGALLVAAAGNSNTSTPMYPAAYAEVISVSAVGADWELASYSNYGSTIDIAAPGGDQADGHITYGIYSTDWDFNSNSPIYNYSDGTSMAAPHVSGVAALLLAQEPSLSRDELRARLFDYAVDLGITGRDNLYGWGLLNARNSLTSTLGPARDLYARLYHEEDGSIAQVIPAEADGSYSFEALEDGSYLVFAGLDENSDQEPGLPGRMWGAYGAGTATPSAIGVSGAGTYPASFAVGWPYEDEPNDSGTEADWLALNGHLRAGFSTTTDVDVYRFVVPSGQYTLETSGWLGACWFADEADTVLELYDQSGQLLASNNDIDVGSYNYCSRITTTLDSGTYEARVTYYDGGGLYQLHLRDGS